MLGACAEGGEAGRRGARHSQGVVAEGLGEAVAGALGRLLLRPLSPPVELFVAVSNCDGKFLRYGSHLFIAQTGKRSCSRQAAKSR